MAACSNWPPMRRWVPTCASCCNSTTPCFTLKLTPNLGHALSVFGVAREVSALTGAPLRTPAIAADRADARAAAAGRDPGRRPVRPLFGPRRARHRHAREDAAWMVDRLARCGQRSVNALVDISNYVMFEYGRPSHIFDLDKIHERPRRALGPVRRDAEAAQRQHHRARRAGRRDRRCARVSNRWPASWAATPLRSATTRATSTSRPRSGGPRRLPAARAASTSRPTPATASNAVSTQHRRSRTSSTSPRWCIEVCGGQRRADGRPDAAAAAARHRCACAWRAPPRCSACR